MKAPAKSKSSPTPVQAKDGARPLDVAQLDKAAGGSRKSGESQQDFTKP